MAFDPGRRIGVAWVDAVGALLCGRVIDADALGAVVVPAGARVVSGNGTGSRALLTALVARGLRPERIDEVGTSELARALYWRSHDAVGLQRWLPAGLRTPPRPIDDFAAYAIALRALGLEGATTARAPRR